MRAFVHLFWGGWIGAVGETGRFPSELILIEVEGWARAEPSGSPLCPSTSIRMSSEKVAFVSSGTPVCAGVFEEGAVWGSWDAAQMNERQRNRG